MALYAEGTTVSPVKSQMEIQQTLERFGASGYMMGWQGDKAAVQFVLNGRQVRIELVLPVDVKEFQKSKGGQWRSADQMTAAMAAETRPRWRSLAFVLKAKLETVATGITTFDEEFGMRLVMPDGRTVGQHVLPRVTEAIESKVMPTTILAIGGGDR